MKARKRMGRPSEYHVVRQADGWAVKSEGSPRATSVHRTQEEAVRRAREIAREKRVTLIVHGRDGRVRSATRYGADPQAVAIAAGREFLQRYRRAFERLAQL